MAAFTRGYLRAGNWRGAPILLHWSIVIGALFFGGFRFAPAFWTGFVGLVLFHELGHAFFVRRYGQRVLSVEVNGIGGLCTWSGKVSPIRRSIISWGGVLAQWLVYSAAQLFVQIQGEPSSAGGQEILYLATTTNLWLILINLIPVRPLDGKEAWQLFPLLYRRWRMRHLLAKDEELRVQRLLSHTKLRAADALEDAAADRPPPEIASLVDDVLRRAKDRGGDPE